MDFSYLNSLCILYIQELWRCHYFSSSCTALYYQVNGKSLNCREKKVTKLSRKNRTELSIIASILTLVHNLFYGFIDHHLFIEVFSNPFVYGKRYFVFTLSSAMAIILLIPLFITSFRTVRKKINPRSWKKIQKLAYPFWILIHLHVLLIYIDVFLNPSEFHGIFLVNAILNMIVYPLSLIIWIYLKIKQKNRKIAKSAH